MIQPTSVWDVGRAATDQPVVQPVVCHVKATLPQLVRVQHPLLLAMIFSYSSVTCRLGYFRSGPRFCSACAIGEYQDVTDLTSCKSCGTIDGFEGSTFGSASIAKTDCFRICPSGSFRAANEEDCALCDYGYYQPLSNAIIVTSRRPCPDGGTTLNKGTASQDFCILMPAPLVRTSISVIIIMNVRSCDNREHIRQTIVDLIVTLIQIQVSAPQLYAAISTSCLSLSAGTTTQGERRDRLIRQQL
ncbi:Egf-domain, multiple [Plakobranchus ocellatus]|uniref:Egf-domain, multiple n=1 Tax=Plakobranchus ocellatus TaxID=259542 RepID=A0AAV3ZQJ4_9GAST|nr:Egf-domain, multiple [Plakobranchus ocellatus]